MRHQILAHRTVKNPPPDVVLGLDVQPLREHAWLDSLADAWVVVVEGFYNRLTRDVGPSHPPVIDLGSDNDYIATMDDNEDLVYRHHDRTPDPSISGGDQSIPCLVLV